MKIGIDISQTVYEGTGSARYVDRLVRGLATHPTNLELTLFGSALKKRRSLEIYKQLGANTKFFPFPPTFFEVLWNQMHTAPFEQFAGVVDIYHSSDWTQAPSRAKKVTTVHDLIPFLFPEYVHPRIKRAHQERWKWIVKEVDHLIVDAECTKQDVISMFQYPADQISVVPLGVEERFIQLGQIRHESKLDTKVLDKYQLSLGGYLLAVGTMEPRKNLPRLIAAYAKLPAEIRSLYGLVVVGKKAWADEIEISEGINVRFTGYVEDEDLPYLYAGAKLFVMPSIYEGFGFPVLEAMASGTPVIASKLSSLPEVGGETIMYFENVEDDNQMAKDLETAILAYPGNLSELAFARAKNMNWEKTVEQTIGVYEKIMG